jgi:ubiquinol-cytochrome c reductase cytochrome b subunit
MPSLAIQYSSDFLTIVQMTRRASFLRQPIVSVVNDHLVDYPTPINFSYWWNFGSLAGICLTIQLATGIFLAMHYIPHVDFAFNSVEHIMRDVDGGWCVRYLHANGASMFFIVVYLHVFRGLYYGSYAAPREMVWCMGVLIMLLMILTAFIGYVLPWGQMSLWGCTVITSLASAVPIIGGDITTWLWGGFSVENPTLNRFFSLHYLFPFIIAGATIVHLASLHQYGSNNPLGINASADKVPFYPYYYVKDVLGVVIFAAFFSFFLFFFPNVLGHADNYIPANPLVTPPHIVPEWYVLPYYAILRSIPHKLGGVVAMMGTFVCLALLPWLNTSEVRSTTFRPIYKVFFWIFVADCLILGWIGQAPVEDPYIIIGQLSSLYFFVYFLCIIPMLGTIEKHLIRGLDS